MPSEADYTPTTTPPGLTALLSASDALDALQDGLDALMYFSVSGHFNATAQSALGFMHAGLCEKCGEARRLVEEARNLKAPPVETDDRAGAGIGAGLGPAVHG